MTPESQTWDSVKTEYLNKVEKSLSSVRHPRSKEVLEDVRSHLDSRFAELAPEQRTWESFQAIITEMGPASDYAELLEPDAGRQTHVGKPKHLWWLVPAAVAAVVVVVLLISFILPQMQQTDSIASEELASQGWMLWNQRKLGEAEQVFKEAVLKDPANANVWNGLGWSQCNLGKPLAAKASFEKCLKLQPEHPAALNGLGWIAKGQGKIDEAIGYWQKAVAAVPNATAALNGLATTYMEQARYDKAVEIYEKWLEVEPDNPQIKAALERARNRKPLAELDDLPDLIAELSDPNALAFEALNKIIKLGSPAVPALLEEMKTSRNWQIPKALGAIGDQRAVLPLIVKLENADFSPMREVVAEALEKITGEKLGDSKEQWRTWWEQNPQTQE